MQGPLASSYRTDPDTLARGMVQRAHHRDGLPEIFAGAGLLIGSGMCWSDTLPAGSRARLVSGIASILLVMAFCLVSSWLTKQVRQRFLLERVGYVRVKINRRHRALSLVIAFVVAVVTALGIWHMRAAEPAKWLIVIVGAMAALFQVAVGRLPRFWLTGAFSLIAALAIASSRLSFPVGLGTYFDLVGVLEVIVGAVVLFRLLHQPAGDER
jgi:hypothetical protein